MRVTLHRPAIAGLALGLAPGIAAAAESAGLPQLDVHSYSSQLFWLAVFFVIVYLFMRFVGVPRVAAIVEQRRAQIGGDIGEAERLRAAAAEARKAYEATMAEAHAKARRMLAETHERNMATLTERTRDATAAFDLRVGEAVKRIDAARAEALRGIGDVARGLASDITAKLSGRAPGPESLARAIDAAAGQEAA